MTRILRLIVALTGIGLLAACEPPNDLDQTPEPLGDFVLGHNIVVSENATIGPLSRKADPEVWKQTLTAEIGKRMGRYDGDKLYHLGVNIDAYVLAVPGVPLVVSPKSVLIISVNVWDDAAGKKLNAKPKQMTVLEHLSGETLVGSGLTQSKKTQMLNLSRNAARAIEKYLRENQEWFGAPPPSAASEAETETSGN